MTIIPWAIWPTLLACLWYTQWTVSLHPMSLICPSLALWWPQACFLYECVSTLHIHAFVLFFTVHMWVIDSICLSLSDGSLSIICFRPIHAAANGEFLFYFFYGWVMLHCVHAHLLIQSPADRHLVFFRVLEVVNSAALNTGLYEPFQISVRLLYHVGVLGSGFGGTSILFSIVAAPWLSSPRLPPLQCGGGTGYSQDPPVFCPSKWGPWTSGISMTLLGKQKLRPHSTCWIRICFHKTLGWFKYKLTLEGRPPTIHFYLHS